MNILVTINKVYLECLKILLKSIKKSNPTEEFVIYLVHKDLTDDDIEQVRMILSLNMELKCIKIDEKLLDSFPVYEKRYPVEIYFRLFASKYLPSSLDRVLYLDSDIVVINNLREIYDTSFDGNYYIATSNVDCFFRKFNEIRLGMVADATYINSGVMMINLEELRKVDMEGDIKSFVKRKKFLLMLPDQDIISALYGDKVKIVDNIKFNLGDRGLIMYNLRNSNAKIDLEWIRENAVIIHYYGKNKPWRKNYRGVLNCFYDEVMDEV